MLKIYKRRLLWYFITSITAAGIFFLSTGGVISGILLVGILDYLHRSIVLAFIFGVLYAFLDQHTPKKFMGLRATTIAKLFVGCGVLTALWGVLSSDIRLGAIGTTVACWGCELLFWPIESEAWQSRRAAKQSPP